MKRRALWAGLAVVAVMVGLIALWPDDEAPSAVESEAGEEDVAPDWERWMILDGPDRPAAPSARRARAADLPVPPEEGWEARREQWRAEWRRGVDIAPLGPSEPGFGPDEIREALAPGREQLRVCVSESGGWRALRESSRARGPQERRRGRSVSFDVRPDGTVDADSVELSPPMPAGLDACFRTFFSSARLEGVGADGARVDLPLGGRGRRPSAGDGGVPRWGGGRQRGERGSVDRGGEERRRLRGIRERGGTESSGQNGVLRE